MRVDGPPFSLYDPQKMNSMRCLLFCLCLVQTAVAAPLSSLYATLDPTSVSQHFAFYELYPNAPEGKEALRHAWKLLSGRCGDCDPELTFPILDLSSILSLVNRPTQENAPLLEEEQLAVIERLSASLGNRRLQGFGLWDQEAILQLAPEQVDLGRTLLLAELGNLPETRAKIRSYEASLDLMALQIHARLSPQSTPLEKIRAINDYIFSEMRFRFPPHSLYAKEIDLYTFLPSVLDSRRGVCLGVSILYLCLAQRLELPLQAITPPGHIYVRYVDPEGETCNIETTARGIDVPSEHYLGIDGKQLQERNIREVVGLAFMNQAAVSWHRGDPGTAVALYEKARPFLGEGDLLLNLFLGINYLFVGKEAEGRALLEKVQRAPSEYSISQETLSEDYLGGWVDAEGLQAVFLEVDENRASILEKQKTLETTLAKHPRFRQGLFHLAVTWLQLGREKEALSLFEKYLAMHATDPTAHYYVSAIHFQRRNFEAAWKHLKATEVIVREHGCAPHALKELRAALKRLCPEPKRGEETMPLSFAESLP